MSKAEINEILFTINLNYISFLKKEHFRRIVKINLNALKDAGWKFQKNELFNKYLECNPVNPNSNLIMASNKIKSYVLSEQNYEFAATLRGIERLLTGLWNEEDKKELSKLITNAFHLFKTSTSKEVNEAMNKLMMEKGIVKIMKNYIINYYTLNAYCTLQNGIIAINHVNSDIAIMPL